VRWCFLQRFDFDLPFFTRSLRAGTLPSTSRTRRPDRFRGGCAARAGGVRVVTGRTFFLRILRWGGVGGASLAWGTAIAGNVTKTKWRNDKIEYKSLQVVDLS
jgi:hypothetical protein